MRKDLQIARSVFVAFGSDSQTYLSSRPSHFLQLSRLQASARLIEETFFHSNITKYRNGDH